MCGVAVMIYVNTSPLVAVSLQRPVSEKGGKGESHPNTISILLNFDNSAIYSSLILLRQNELAWTWMGG